MQRIHKRLEHWRVQVGSLAKDEDLKCWQQGVTPQHRPSKRRKVCQLCRACRLQRGQSELSSIMARADSGRSHFRMGLIAVILISC